MKQMILAGTVMLVLFGCRTGGTGLQTDTQAGAFELEDPAARQRLASVRAELAALERHEWAGTYHRGAPGADAVGDDLILAPGAGYVLQLRGRTGVCRSGCPNCAAGKTSVAQGMIVPGANGTLKLAMALEPGEVVLVDELLPLRWGDRHYLIGVEELEAFQAAIRDGQEPRRTMAGAFFLRENDENVPVSGPPPKPLG